MWEKDKLQAAIDLIQNSHSIYVLTGAGISTSVGIPDLAHLPHSYSLSSESSLEQDPVGFYQEFHHVFTDPIFHHGPSEAHKILADWEKQNIVKGVVTTNVDYLHEIAGNRNVADIWRNLNRNYCTQCGHVFDIQILDETIPRCPVCGGLVSPGPVFHNISTSSEAVMIANHWMNMADLVITIGSNGYYSNTGNAKILDINPTENSFSNEAEVHLQMKADQALTRLNNMLK